MDNTQVIGTAVFGRDAGGALYYLNCLLRFIRCEDPLEVLTVSDREQPPLFKEDIAEELSREFPYILLEMKELFYIPIRVPKSSLGQFTPLTQED